MHPMLDGCATGPTVADAYLEARRDPEGGRHFRKAPVWAVTHPKVIGYTVVRKNFKRRLVNERSRVVEASLPTLRRLAHKAGVEVLPLPSSRRHPPSLLGPHLTDLLASLNVDLVLDVGAQVGRYGWFLRRHGYTGRIVSFEPVRSNLDVLRPLATADGLWDVRAVALGDESETLEIHVPSAATDFSSFLPTAEWVGDFYRPAVPDRGEAVPVRRLDDIWEEVVHGARSVFLKSDTQGWDLHVLRGLGDRSPDVVGIQIEVAFEPVYEGAPTVTEALRVLDEFGFGVTQLFPVTARDDGRAVEMDVVAIRRDGARWSR